MAFHCIRCKNELDKSYKACPKCGEPVTEFLRQHLEQPLDGKYEILERLGAGGMGEVYKVRHTYLGSTRVIKVVHPQISDSADAKDRFLREARASTKVQHPNVATLHDFSGLPDGAHYMVWEFIDGENLAQRIRARGTIPPRQAVRIAIQALRGLDAIHRAGIIHRDISPENLMITHEDETVKIIDLGVAKVEDSLEGAGTATGIFVGKLRYAAPEQLGFLPEGEKIDARADLYALAMVLYEMLTGRPPYEAKSPHEYFLLHAREQTQPRVIELPQTLPGGATLQAVMQRALASDRKERYTSAREFAAALEEVERTLPDPRDMPTMAVPLDGDATMRFTPAPAPLVPSQVDTLHRETVRTASPASQAAATAMTPLPAAPQAGAPPTVLTPLPSSIPSHMPPPPPPPMAAAPAKMRKGISPVWIIAIVFLFIGAMVAAAVVFWPKKDRPPIVQLPGTTTTSTTTPPAQVAEASVNVVPEGTVTTPTPATTTIAPPPVTTTTAEPVLSQPVTTTTVAPPPAVEPTPTPIKRPEVKPKPAPPVATEPEEEPEPAPPVRTPQSSGPVTPAAGTYVDGGDDEDGNERALDVLRKEMRGVREVELRGDMYNWVQRTVRNTGLSIVDSAEVIIDFQGTYEQLGRGRKKRSARVTVTKRGKPIFRYVLPEEVYRVGDAPPEAFARVLSDAVE